MDWRQQVRKLFPRHAPTQERRIAIERLQHLCLAATGAAQVLADERADELEVQKALKLARDVIAEVEGTDFDTQAKLGLVTAIACAAEHAGADSDLAARLAAEWFVRSFPDYLTPDGARAHLPRWRDAVAAWAARPGPGLEEKWPQVARLGETIRNGRAAPLSYRKLWNRHLRRAREINPRTQRVPAGS